MYSSLLLTILTFGATSEGFNCSSDEGNAKMSGGRKAVAGEYPYVARIIFNLGTLCSGTVISKTFVLTAAHCLTFPDGSLIKVVSDVEVQYDIIEVPESLSPLFKTKHQRKAKTFKIHPDFSRDEVGMFDYALIETETEMDITKVLHLSDHPWPQDDSGMYNRPCTTVGWGSLDTGRGGSQFLLKAQVTARHGYLGCKCFFKDEYLRLVCTNEKVHGLCDYDNGAPLVCDDRCVGVGHTYFAIEKCNPLRHTPLDKSCKTGVSIYMYVCPALDWIHKYVPEVPLRPDSCRGSRTVPIFAFILKYIF